MSRVARSGLWSSKQAGVQTVDPGNSRMVPDPDGGARGRVSRRRRMVVLPALGALVVLAAACGSSASSSSASSSTAASGAAVSKSTPTATVSVGVLPIADVAPLYVGMKEGFFAAEHIDVQPKMFQGGAAIASAVVGGSLDFGFAAAVNMILAKAQGLPVQIVANGDNAALTAANAWSAIMVSGSSSITSVKQLAGTTIATNAVDGVNELAVDGILLKNGVNPSSVHFVVLNFPDMPAALSSGHVQAVSDSEPFVTAIKAQGGRVITPLFEGYLPGMTVGTYIASTSEISSQSGVVARFAAAIQKSLSYSAAHPSVVRQVIPTYTSITAAVASKMQLPTYDSVLNLSSFTTQEALMRKLGWMSKSVSLSSLIWSGAAK